MGKLIFAILFAFGFSAMAQTTTSMNKSSARVSSSKTRMYLGSMPMRLQGVVGINNSKLLSDSRNSSIRDGYVLGALTDFGSGAAVFETGLLYLQMGGADNGSLLKINYLAIPLFAKFYASPKQVGFYGKAGAMLAKLRSAELSTPGINGRTTKDFEEFTKDEDFMLGLGVGYVFETDADYAFSIELDYLRGDHKIYSNPDGSNGIRNEGVSMRAGIRL